MRNLEWFDGMPKEFEPGILVQWHDGSVELSGHDSTYENWDKVKRWAWVIKPHELEWAADMAGKHAKGRPEQ